MGDSRSVLDVKGVAVGGGSHRMQCVIQLAFICRCDVVGALQLLRRKVASVIF